MTKIIKLTMIHIHNTNIISEIGKRSTALIQVLQSNSSDLLLYLYKFSRYVNFVVFMDNV